MSVAQMAKAGRVPLMIQVDPFVKAEHVWSIEQGQPEQELVVLKIPQQIGGLEVKSQVDAPAIH